jgi:hypothetical protein
MVRLHPFASPGDVALVAERLACNEEERVRLPPSPLSSLRSVNGKHAPFVRPRCGFDSCRRLLRGRSSAGRARERHFREARSIRVVRFTGLWCKRQHGELQPRRSGFESWRACCQIVSGRSGSVIWCERAPWCTLRFESASRPHPTTATSHSAAGRNGSGYRLLIDRSRVRLPPGALVLR